MLTVTVRPVSSDGAAESQGRDLERAIVYGSVATPLAKKNEDQHTHKWSIYVRGINNEDISYFIKNVTFRLHESFAQPNRTIDTFPFEVSETGWGEFEVSLKIQFQDPAEKPLTLFHHLRLYTSNETIMRDKSIVCEKYDEIVFNEPTELMFDLLTKNKNISVPSRKSEAFLHHSQIEKTEFNKIGEAHQKVRTEIQQYRARLQAAENEAAQLTREVGDLDPNYVPPTAT